MTNLDYRKRKVQAYSGTVASKFLYADRKYALLSPLMTSKEFISRYDDSLGAHGLKTLRISLYLDVIQDLSALTYDSNPRAACLSNLSCLLGRQELLNALREDFCRVDFENLHRSGMDEIVAAQMHAQFIEEQALERGQTFDDTVERIRIALENVLDSDLWSRIKKTRDKTISHFQMTAAGEDPRPVTLEDIGLTWGSIGEFMSMVEPIVFDVEMVVSGATYALEDFKKSHKQIGDDFWKLSPA